MADKKQETSSRICQTINRNYHKDHFARKQCIYLSSAQAPPKAKHSSFRRTEPPKLTTVRARFSKMHPDRHSLTVSANYMTIQYMYSRCTTSATLKIRKTIFMAKGGMEGSRWKFVSHWSDTAGTPSGLLLTNWTQSFEIQRRENRGGSASHKQTMLFNLFSFDTINPTGVKSSGIQYTHITTIRRSANGDYDVGRRPVDHEDGGRRRR